MRKAVSSVIALMMVVFALAAIAHGGPVDTGAARANGWRVTMALGAIDLGGAASVSLADCATPPPSPCQRHDEGQFLNATAFGGGPARADVLRAEADASRDGGTTASMQSVMAGAWANASAIPTAWNTRAYARAEGFSALNGTILADALESESVTASNASGGTVGATAARVVNLRLAGALAPYSLAAINPGQPNQVLLDAAGVRIVFWETNWVPGNATTPEGLDLTVSALHITDATTGTDIHVALAATSATSSVPTTDPSPTPSTDPTVDPTPDPTPSTDPSADPTPPTDPDPTPSTGPEPDPDPTPPTDPDPDPSPSTDPDPDPTPSTDPDPTPSTNPDPDPSPVTDPDPGPTPPTDPDPDPSPSADPGPGPDPGGGSTGGDATGGGSTGGDPEGNGSGPGGDGTSDPGGTDPGSTDPGGGGPTSGATPEVVDETDDSDTPAPNLGGGWTGIDPLLDAVAGDQTGRADRDGDKGRGGHREQPGGPRPPATPRRQADPATPATRGPTTPALPTTGAPITGFTALALNLMVAGGLVLLLNMGRATAMSPAPSTPGLAPLLPRAMQTTDDDHAAEIRPARRSTTHKKTTRARGSHSGSTGVPTAPSPATAKRAGRMSTVARRSSGSRPRR